MAFYPCAVDKPPPSVMATNIKPISVAPAVAPTMKKFSQPWNIAVLRSEDGASYRTKRRRCFVRSHERQASELVVAQNYLGLEGMHPVPSSK